MMSAVLFASIAQAQYKYKRTLEKHQQLLQAFDTFPYQGVRDFVVENQITPSSGFEQVVYAEMMPYTLQSYQSYIDTSSYKVLDRKTVYYLLDLINDPSPFTFGQPGTNVVYKRLYFIRDGQVVTKAEIWGDATFYVDQAPFVHGMLDESQGDKYRRLLELVDAYDVGVSPALKRELILFDLYPSQGLYTLGGQSKIYRTEDNQHGLQVFVTSSLQRLHAFGKKLQKRFPHQQVMVKSTLDQDQEPLYKLYIAGFRSKESVTSFKAKNKELLPGAFWVQFSY
jgi:hypothetical protein